MVVWNLTHNICEVYLYLGEREANSTHWVNLSVITSPNRAPASISWDSENEYCYLYICFRFPIENLMELIFSVLFIEVWVSNKLAFELYMC